MLSETGEFDFDMDYECYIRNCAQTLNFVDFRQVCFKILIVLKNALVFCIGVTFFSVQEKTKLKLLGENKTNVN